MADNNHLFSVPRYNGTMLNNEYCNDFFDFGQQKTIGNTSFISMVAMSKTPHIQYLCRFRSMATSFITPNL